MSQTDSFINEVTEEVRRDRLFALMRRYGWIAVLAILILVGGAAWTEWRKAQDRRAAEALGDSILAALEAEDQGARAEALLAVEAPNSASAAMIDLLAASELAASDAPSDAPAAAGRLIELADNPEVAPVYRQIATIKAVSLPGSGLTLDAQRNRLDGLALSGGLIGLLAAEQLALLDVQAGKSDAALERLQQIVTDAEATPGLRRRASQVIVALGGVLPETGDDQ